MGTIHHVVTRTNWTLVLAVVIASATLYAGLSRIADALKPSVSSVHVTLQTGDKKPVVKAWTVGPDGKVTPAP